MNVPIEHQAAAEELLGELEGSCLEVALVPTRWRMNEGGCIRVAVSKNATWYQRFCRQHPSARIRKNQAFDTRIKRRNTIRALARFAQGASPRGLRPGAFTVNDCCLSSGSGPRPPSPARYE